MKKKLLKSILLILAMFACILSVDASEYIKDGYTLKSLKEKMLPYKINGFSRLSNIIELHSTEAYECSGGNNNKCYNYEMDFNGNIAKIYYNDSDGESDDNYEFLILKNNKINKCINDNDNCTIFDENLTVDQLFVYTSNKYSDKIHIIKTGNKYGLISNNETILQPSENYELVNGTYGKWYMADDDGNELEIDVSSLAVLYDKVNNEYIFAFNDNSIERLSKTYLLTEGIAINETTFNIEVAYRTNSGSANSTIYSSEYYNTEHDTNSSAPTYLYKLFNKDVELNDRAESDIILNYNNQLVYLVSKYIDFKYVKKLYNIYTGDAIENSCNIYCEGNTYCYSSPDYYLLDCSSTSDKTLSLFVNNEKVLEYNPWDKFGYTQSDNFRSLINLDGVYLLNFNNENYYYFFDVYAKNEVFSSVKVKTYKDVYEDYKNNVLKKVESDKVINVYSDRQLSQYHSEGYYDDESDKYIYVYEIPKSDINETNDHYAMYLYDGTNSTFVDSYALKLNEDGDAYSFEISYETIEDYSYTGVYVLVGYNDVTADTNSTSDKEQVDTGATLPMVIIGALALTGGVIITNKRRKLFNRI